MRAEFWAVLTALCWAGGSFLEKKGVRLGGFSPIMGTTIRTVTSAVLLTVLSYRLWPQLQAGGAKPIVLIMVGGGVLAGTVGISSFYQALRTGELSVVLPLAFCLTPVVGVVLGWIILGERLNVAQYGGIALTIIGATIAVYYE